MLLPYHQTKLPRHVARDCLMAGFHELVNQYYPVNCYCFSGKMNRKLHKQYHCHITSFTASTYDHLYYLLDCTTRIIPYVMLFFSVLYLSVAPVPYFLESSLYLSYLGCIVCQQCLALRPKKQSTVIFERSTGRFIDSDNQLILDFSQLDAYCYEHQSQLKTHHYELILKCPCSGCTWSLGHFSSFMQLHVMWMLLLSYMNKQLPLPDLPQFEMVRSLDSTTQQHDKATHRPHQYWRSMDKGKIKELCQQAYRQYFSFLD